MAFGPSPYLDWKIMTSAHYDAHLIFDNSPTPERYFYSSGSFTAPSMLGLARGKLPVSAHALSPPNALRLSWCSGRGGDWEAEVKLESRRGRAPDLQGDTLSLWCFAEFPTAVSQLPLLALGLRGGGRTQAVRLGHYSQDLLGGGWQQVKIPLTAFGGSTGEQNLLELERLIFSQCLDDAEPHTLLLDEIRLLDSTLTGEPYTPTNLTATGYPHHIELAWDAVPNRYTAYYLVQRAFEGEFISIGIQRPEVQRFTDYLGKPGVRARYRVTAVSYDHLESEPSEIAEAETRPFSDDELLDMVQAASIRPYSERAHPEAGLALECLPGMDNLVALGASGFGIMALIVAAERGFLTRASVRAQLLKAVRFLAAADRFHGVWPHFLDGRTGKTIPLFGCYDNGGDLVETAFMIQGLLTARQYFTQTHPDEQEICTTITRLWEEVEWDWYRRTPDSEVLYWHWSPDYEWEIGHPLTGWNEAMIVYVLAIASPTHSVPASLYETGWASQAVWAQEYRQNWGKTSAGAFYGNGESYEGLTLPVGVGSGGPLFFTHYSFLGFDPRSARDRFTARFETDYFGNNRTLSLINHHYCARNPQSYKGYSNVCWGLSASDDHTGYSAHDPTPARDNGTLTPTAALSAFPYTPDESLAALKHFYLERGAQLWDVYGFKDAFNDTEDYVSTISMGLNQAPTAVMIENHRSGLLWRLFMANPELEGVMQTIFSH